jgi:hypothetical protein
LQSIALITAQAFPVLLHKDHVVSRILVLILEQYRLRIPQYVISHLCLSLHQQIAEVGCHHPLLLLPRKYCHLLNLNCLSSFTGLDHLDGQSLHAHLLIGSLPAGFYVQLLPEQGNQL